MKFRIFRFCVMKQNQCRLESLQFVQDRNVNGWFNQDAREYFDINREQNIGNFC